MKDNFDLRKFLSENKLTSNSRMLKEESESFRYEIIDPSQDANSLDRILDAIDLLNKEGIKLIPQDKTGHYSGGYNDVNSVFVSSKMPYKHLIRKVNDILFGTEFEKLRIMEVMSEDIYGGYFDDDYGSNDGSSLYGGNVPSSHDDSEYISQLVKDTVTHFEREVTLGNLEPEDISLKMIKDTAGVDSKVAKQIAIEIEDLFNLMPSAIKEEEEDQEGADYNYDVTEEVEVGMRVIDAQNDLFEVIEVTPTRITLEPVGYEGEDVYFPEDFGKDVNIEDFWFHLEEQEEERTGMFGEPYDSDEEGGIPFFSKGLREVVDDNTLENNINNLESEDIFTITGKPSSFMDDEEKVLQGLLKVIKKVNPEVDLDKKKMSFSRDFDKTIENLKSAQWKSFSVERGVKDYFIKNLFMFK